MPNLADIGEYAFHRLLRNAIAPNESTTVIGDDCAYIDTMSGEALLVTVDRLSSAVPRRSQADLLVTQTLSDIVCMGGTPMALLVAVEYPRETPVDEALEFLRMVNAEAQRYGCTLVGATPKRDRN